MESRGNFRCDGGSCCEGMTPRLCRLWNLTWPCPIVMLKRGCKQSVDSAGMACEGRARNRMLRKRWIVRNPVVGEDDVTQFILARSLNTSSAFVFLWSERLITRQFWSESLNTFQTKLWLLCVISEEIEREGGNLRFKSTTQWWRSLFCVSGVKQHLLRHRDPRRSLIVIWLFSAHLIRWKQSLLPKHRRCCWAAYLLISSSVRGF